MIIFSFVDKRCVFLSPWIADPVGVKTKKLRSLDKHVCSISRYANVVEGDKNDLTSYVEQGPVVKVIDASYISHSNSDDIYNHHSRSSNFIKTAVFVVGFWIHSKSLIIKFLDNWILNLSTIFYENIDF